VLWSFRKQDGEEGPRSVLATLVVEGMFSRFAPTNVSCPFWTEPFVRIHDRCLDGVGVGVGSTTLPTPEGFGDFCWPARCSTFASPLPVFRSECHRRLSELDMGNSARLGFIFNHSSTQIVLYLTRTCQSPTAVSLLSQLAHGPREPELR
jgi:hypothetical protein